MFTAGFSFGDSYGAAFMKFDGIDGESKDDGHKDWIIIESVTIPSEDNTSKVVHLTKKLDYSSAAISQSAISGKVHERAILDVCSEREQECKRFDLTNVFFTSYFVSASENQRPMEEISFVYERITQSTSTEKEPVEKSNTEPKTERPTVDDIPAREIVQEKVPSWVQTTANFWVDGNVSDKEFTDGIGYLVREKIIELEPIKIESSGQQAEPEVPSWIKQNTKWWIEGQVPEDQFLDSIKWLIQNNIITGVSS